MDRITIGALAVTIAAPLIFAAAGMSDVAFPGISSNLAGGKHAKPAGNASKSGKLILGVFLIAIVLLGAVTFVRFRADVAANADLLLYAIWLLLFMIGGMFVQVISVNRHNKRPLFQVKAADLIYPLLFSVVVFYPIWTLAADAPHSLFVFHAAFLNGFFWESVVKEAKP